MPRIEYDVVFNIDKSVSKKINSALSGAGRTGSKSSPAEEQAQSLNKSLIRVGNTSELTAKNLKEMASSSATSFTVMSGNANRFAASMANANRQVGKGNANFASANQLVFSFSDGIQDAAQFSQGFGTGMRAIGNNLSFTAELLGVTARNAKEAGVSMRTALKSAITPVTGAILALNIALTAGQFLFDAMGRKAKDAKNELGDFEVEARRVTSFFKDIAESRITDFQEINDTIDKQTEALQGSLSILENQENSIQRQIEALQKVVPLIQGQTDDAKEGRRVNAEKLSQLLQQQDTEGEINKLAQDIIKNKLAELRAQRLINDALRDALDVTIKTNDEFEKMVDDFLANPIQVQFDPVMGDGAEIDPSSRAEEQLRLQEALFNARIQLESGFERKRMQLVKDRIDRTVNLIDAGVEREQAIKMSNLIFEKQLNDARIEEERRVAKERINLEKLVRDSRVSLQQSAARAITSIQSGLLGDNKALALSLLAIEKGLAIAEVAIDGAKSAATATAYGAKMAAQSLTPFGVNPAATAAAANAYAQAGKIKAMTAANIALIAATGLGEAAGILSGGGSGGSVGASSGSGSGNNAFIRRDGEVEPPQFNPRDLQRNQINLTVIGEVDKKGIAFAVREGNRQIRANQVSV